MFESFNSIDEMWRGLLADLFSKRGGTQSRNGDTQEIVGWSARLTDVNRNFLCNERRALSPVYASAELLWYLSRRQTVEMLLPYAPQYERFIEEDRKAYGAYGYRIRNNIGYEDQLDVAIRRLRNDPNCRQIVVSLWRPDDLLVTDKKDVPCTVCWQFLLRNNKLHMVAYMRSNDAWLGFPYDVYCNTSIQAMTAATLGVQPGDYVHKVGSMHLYEKNSKAAIEAYDVITDTLPHNWSWSKFDAIQWAVVREADVRCCYLQTVEVLEQGIVKPGQVIGEASSLADAVRCCATKFIPTVEAGIVSPALKKGFENLCS